MVLSLGLEQPPKVIASQVNIPRTKDEEPTDNIVRAVVRLSSRASPAEISLLKQVTLFSRSDILAAAPPDPNPGNRIFLQRLH
jgi:hypothetical protein